MQNRLGRAARAGTFVLRMDDPAPLPPSVLEPRGNSRGPLLSFGFWQLLFLAGVAVAAALTTARIVTAHEEVKIDGPSGPLFHLDQPAVSASAPAPAVPVPPSSGDDASVRILPDAGH
jgi:hypothetical protein